ncbi:MAG: biotin-dependent carboxyltransferase family protein [Kofleriaceae bacterium]|nr:biotin-dependent carboxyltransferase family protein [Candidatus Methylomirabilis lanthanidiphila]
MDAFEVIKPGLLTTVQDLGRIGYQRYGVPTSGAMDQTALRAANLLLDNGEGFAGLEATADGPALRALTDVVVAIVGADMGPLVDGQPVACGTAIRIRRGKMLEFQRARRGLRAYLAVAGGIDVPVMLGSRSTCLPAAFGGFQGRAVRQGDRLPLGFVGHQPQAVSGRRLPSGWLEPIGEVLTVRVVLGLQEDRFTPDGIRAFLSELYRFTPQMDRMGARLQGPPIAHRSSADIVSDSTPLGAVQVAADGQPMILLADHQTTGGYTKIAVLVQEDVFRLGQAVPGQIVRFRHISLSEACAVRKTYHERFDALRRVWQSRPGVPDRYRLRLGAGSYRVGVEDGSATYRVSVEGVKRESDDAEQQ